MKIAPKQIVQGSFLEVPVKRFGEPLRLINTIGIRGIRDDKNSNKIQQELVQQTFRNALANAHNKIVFFQSEDFLPKF